MLRLTADENFNHDIVRGILRMCVMSGKKNVKNNYVLLRRARGVTGTHYL